MGNVGVVILNRLTNKNVTRHGKSEGVSPGPPLEDEQGMAITKAWSQEEQQEVQGSQNGVRHTKCNKRCVKPMTFTLNFRRSLPGEEKKSGGMIL